MSSPTAAQRKAQSQRDKALALYKKKPMAGRVGSPRPPRPPPRRVAAPRSNMRGFAQPIRNNPTMNNKFTRTPILGGVRVTGREYLITVKSDGNPGQPGQCLAFLDINPFYWEGTALQQESKSWEKFCFKKLNFLWLPGVGTEVDGTIGLAYDHDPLDATPPASDAGIHQYGAFEDNTGTPVSKPVTLVTHPCDGKEMAFFMNESSGGDPRLVYQGTIYVFNRIPSGEPVAKSLGTLEVEFTVDFMIRQLESPVTSYSGNGTTSYSTPGAQSSSVNANTPSPVSNIVSQAFGTTASQVLSAAGVPPVLIPSVVALGNAAAGITQGQAVQLREGNYLVNTSLDYGDSVNTSDVQINDPVILNAKGSSEAPTPSPASAPMNNPIIEQLGGYFKNISKAQYTAYDRSTDPGLVLERTDLVCIPPGGGYLDGLCLGVGVQNETADVGGVNMTISPIDYRIANMLAGISQTVPDPKPVLHTGKLTKSRPKDTRPLIPSKAGNQDRRTFEKVVESRQTLDEDASVRRLSALQNRLTEEDIEDVPQQLRERVLTKLRAAGLNLPVERKP